MSDSHVTLIEALANLRATNARLANLADDLEEVNQALPHEFQADREHSLLDQVKDLVKDWKLLRLGHDAGCTDEAHLVAVRNANSLADALKAAELDCAQLRAKETI